MLSFRTSSARLPSLIAAQSRILTAQAKAASCTATENRILGARRKSFINGGGHVYDCTLPVCAPVGLDTRYLTRARGSALGSILVSIEVVSGPYGSPSWSLHEIESVAGLSPACRVRRSSGAAAPEISASIPESGAGSGAAPRAHGRSRLELSGASLRARGAAARTRSRARHRARDRGRRAGGSVSC